MVPKDSGFNKSVAASGMCARKAWRFPGSIATVRDGKLVQMPHSSHHVETIRHPNSSYVTTKLYGTSTCGCNNDTIFSKRAILKCLTVDVYVRLAAGRPWSCMQSSNMAILLTSLLFVFDISFLPKYRVNYYDYIVKWCSRIIIGVYRLIFPKF